MQALADIARDSPVLLPIVRQHITELTIIGTPAMKARGRKLLTELSGLTAYMDSSRDASGALVDANVDMASSVNRASCGCLPRVQ